MTNHKDHYARLRAEGSNLRQALNAYRATFSWCGELSGCDSSEEFVDMLRSIEARLREIACEQTKIIDLVKHDAAVLHAKSFSALTATHRRTCKAPKDAAKTMTETQMVQDICRARYGRRATLLALLA